LFDWSFEGVPSGTTCATSFSCAGIDKEAAIDELVAVVEKIKPCKLYIKCGKKDAEALSKRLEFEIINVYESKRKPRGGGKC